MSENTRDYEETAQRQSRDNQPIIIFNRFERLDDDLVALDETNFEERIVRYETETNNTGRGDPIRDEEETKGRASFLRSAACRNDRGVARICGT